MDELATNATAKKKETSQEKARIIGDSLSTFGCQIMHRCSHKHCDETKGRLYELFQRGHSTMHQGIVTLRQSLHTEPGENVAPLSGRGIHSAAADGRRRHQITKDCRTLVDIIEKCYSAGAKKIDAAASSGRRKRMCKIRQRAR